MTTRACDSGFTLVEMLVTLALLALALTISLPYVQTSGHSQLLAAEARRIAAGLTEARSLALTTGKVTSVTFDLEAGTVTGRPGQRPRKLFAVDVITLTTADDLIVDKVGSIGFFPDGGSTGGSIALSKGTHKRIVEVNWLTGAIIVKDVASP